MALKFWRENFYVLFPVPCSSFPEKSGNSRELPGSHFREFPNWHNLIYTSNYTITVKKTSKQSIGWPYGQCVHYPTNGQQLGATSQTHCYRNCIKQLYKTQFNCIPLFVDKLLHESDINYLMTTRIKLCETSPQMLKRIRNINPNICQNKCPDNCRKVEYSSVKQRADGIPEWFAIPHRRFVWNTQPMLAYIEEPVMTFTQFVVNCGGLMGLWFGKSAKDLIVWLIELKASNRINLLGIIINTN